MATSLSILGHTYFIPVLRNFLKKISRSFVVCQKAYAKPMCQIMGLLPQVRTTPAAVFASTGVDFAGPFQLKLGHTRKPVIIKAYVCIFVCMVTRAVHLELCSGLVTQEFLAIFRKFCNRRGTPTDVYSDNGSNFVIRELHLSSVDYPRGQVALYSFTHTSFRGFVGGRSKVDENPAQETPHTTPSPS